MQRNIEHKGLFGIGGIDCPCCRTKGAAHMSKRSAKRYSARITRRHTAIAIRREVMEVGRGN